MTAHPIPDAALDDRLGFLGMTGSGKTFGAGTCVERILTKRGRVIIPDPLGVWWGLRQMADGVTASPYEIVIFGGPHADLPLTPAAGAIIGETVAGMRESAIIDLSQFETAASERRFMLAFLEALYRRSTGEPVHLVFDEADMWAPERIVDKEGEATKLHGMMQSIVRRGRIKGLTSWLISQRPAALSKNVLSQVDGLIAFRLTASQDRKALGLWIEGQADRETGKAILGRLPEKHQGEAVVWLPARGVLADVMFPPKHTYDSSRAPKRGEKNRKVDLKPLDLGALKERLATVEQEAKANDPAKLKAEVARLTRELQKQPTNITENITAPDPKAIEAAEKRGYERGFVDGEIQGHSAAISAVRPEIEKIVAAAQQTLDLATSTTKALSATERFHATANKRTAPIPAPRQVQRPDRQPAALAEGANGTLSGPQHRIIDAIAWWAALGFPKPTRTQVAFVASYKPNTGTFNTYLGALKTSGFIDGVSGSVWLTEQGRAAANDPGQPSAEELRDRVSKVLSGPQNKILDALCGIWPKSATRSDLAESVGYQPNTGTFNTYLGSLSTLGIVSYPGRGEVQAAEWLFL